MLLALCEAKYMISYRAPLASEAVALAEHGRLCFSTAFGHTYLPEDLKYFLDSSYADTLVESRVNDASMQYRIALEHGKIIGHCLVGFDVSLDYDPGVHRTLELKQLYIRPDVIGSGIGAAFMEWVIALARARSYDEIILSAWSENFGAQRFYARFGFEHIGNIFFHVGNQVDDEFLYRLRLNR